MPKARTTKKSAPAKTTKSASKKTAAKKSSARVTKSTATRQKMAQSQQARRAVSNYLEALHTPKRRGRQVSAETLKQRLRDAEAKASKAVGVAKLDALKAVHELESRLKSASSTTAKDMKALEQAFIKHAKTYSERKDIPHHVWRKAGVPANVLQRAGIKRARQS